eukprot:12229889-Alexandrium_andersonii.AAC.1
MERATLQPKGKGGREGRALGLPPLSSGNQEPNTAGEKGVGGLRQPGLGGFWTAGRLGQPTGA